MGVVGLERERERDCLILYKHIEMMGDLCTENAHNPASIIGMNTHTCTYLDKGGFLWEQTVF